MLEVLRSVFMTPLPVPAPSGPGADRDGDGSTGGDEWPWEQPEIDIFGFPGIENPDADREFPAPEWYAEC